MAKIPTKLIDQHVHNHFSFDSQETIKKYLHKAEELQMDFIEFTNHYDYITPYGGNGFIYDLNEEEKELKNIQSTCHNISIKRGIEMGYTPGKMEILGNIIKKHKFNVVNYSLHYYDGIDFYETSHFLKHGVKNTLDIYFNALIEMAKCFNNYDVFCHVDYGFKTAYLLDNTLKISTYETQLIELFKIIIRNNKSLEINTKVQCILNDDHLCYILRLYKRLGGKNITLASDAHESENLCRDFDKYRKLLINEGFYFVQIYIDRKPYPFDIRE